MYCAEQSVMCKNNHPLSLKAGLISLSFSLRVAHGLLSNLQAKYGMANLLHFPRVENQKEGDPTERFVTDFKLSLIMILGREYDNNYIYGSPQPHCDIVVRFGIGKVLLVYV